MKKRGQVSMEYLIIIGFVTFIIIGILGISIIYSSSIKDRIKVIQINNFGSKLISSAESVFYAGNPSKITIQTYLTENIEDITITSKTIIITYYLSTGMSKTAFTSEIPLEGTITTSSGIKNIEIVAGDDKAYINSI